MARRFHVLAALAVAAGAIVTVASSTSAASIPVPDADSFYTPPSPLPDVAPGTVLRSRSVTESMGSSLSVRAWQLLYTSTDTDGTPVADVTTVLYPKAVGPGRPLVSYQTAEDSLATSCAPSYGLRTGAEKEESLILAALEQGWIVAVPDYEGPRSQWTAGVQEGHAVLDGVRAAESYAPLGLSPTSPVGLWGYSGVRRRPRGRASSRRATHPS